MAAVEVRRELSSSGGGDAPIKQLTKVKTRKRESATVVLGNKQKQRRGAGSILFSITCGLCIFLSFTCSCLTVFLILVGQHVDAAYSAYDLKRLQEYSTVAKMSASNTSFRLPPDVRPLNYDLYLKPNLQGDVFDGQVSILIDVSAKRDFIMLHQKDLVINSVNLKAHDRDDNYVIEIKESHTVDENESLIITPKNTLEMGLYDLSISFSGSLKNKIVGLYSSRYRDEDNKTRVIATSKFEPTYARRSFPCFDEPGFKAEFSIKLVHPSGNCYSALSNMNIKSTSVDDPEPGLTTVTFAKSVPMSTYLACFIVSDFVAVTRKATGLDGRTFPVSVYTTRAQKEKGSFALDVGVQIIEYYINLFKIDYPLPKMDMAAIPDFVSGAMENWGLVTYREARLLYDNKTTSTAAKEDIVQVIAHEFAHMWFGNLVTMRWWDDLWLNEGFATYMQFKSSDAVFPDWHFMDHFLIKELYPAFATDAKLSSHPIVQTVGNPDEITAIFDVISYQKGASILRMLENFVGTNIFYAGVTKYLKKFSYENADTSDLFNMLQQTLGNQINIKNIMDTWTRQMGFPVVNVRKHRFTYTLTQKRFLANSKLNFDPSESKFGYKWTIPITYITSENSTPTLVWFDKDALALVIRMDEPVDWIKFNANQVGYYRVNYDDTEWETLLNVLRTSHKRLTAQDRTHLLEDAFSLAYAGELDYNVAMNMTLYLGSEKHFSPWNVATSKLKAMDTLLSSTTISSKYRTYIRELVDGTYHDVTWNIDESEAPELLNLRTTILELACSVGHIECLEEVGTIFRAWINDEKDVRPHPDIRSQIYYYGMNNAGGETEWNIMFKRFVNENNAAEKVKLMYGLAGIRSGAILKKRYQQECAKQNVFRTQCAKQKLFNAFQTSFRTECAKQMLQLRVPGIHALREEKYINLAMDEKYVRSQDALNCLSYISLNPDGSHLVWDWVRENWQLLVDRYTLNDRYLGQLIPAITRNFATKVKLDEIRAFFEKNPEAGAGAIYRAQALETVETNINWLESNSQKIDRWLDSRPVPRHIS